MTTAIPEFTEEAVLAYEKASGLVGIGNLLERRGKIVICRDEGLTNGECRTVRK
jgi:hypothetical protein